MGKKEKKIKQVEEKNKKTAAVLRVFIMSSFVIYSLGKGRDFVFLFLGGPDKF